MLENEAKSKKRLGAEEKFHIFLETCRGDVAIAQVLRKHGLYFSDLKRIREKVERGALRELSHKAQRGNGSGEVTRTAYESLKAEKERQERALIELSIENTLLKKKLR